MVTAARVRELLAPFKLKLTDHQVATLLTYLELLLRWNEKINLTAVRSAEECVARHFGESLFLANAFELRGRLLDIGSGAGFPGLALKIPFPELSVTLLEPTAKKRAFLKEAARACQMDRVEVRPERFEQFESPLLFDTATARAVGGIDALISQAACCLAPGGRLCLWVTRDQARGLVETSDSFEWQAPVAVPLGHKREIWVGIRRAISA